MTSFKDIAINALFTFAPSKDGTFKDSFTYRKTGSRSYCRIDSTGGLMGPAYRVGSIAAKVNPA